jgi:DNA-binding response OmpR family regulator
MEKRILLIDDDISVLEILEEVLTAKGFHTVTLTQTDKVFEAIAEHQPELVLIDYLLQGINGGEICAEIKRNKAKPIRVILMTAYPRVLLSLGTYNCDEFLEKPFDLDHLISRVEYHLDADGAVQTGKINTV